MGMWRQRGWASVKETEMEVRDAETGEKIAVALPHATPQELFGQATPSPSPGKRLQLGSSASSSLLPPLALSPSRKEIQQPLRSPPNNADNQSFFFPETQSTRAMGTRVSWQQDQQARVQRAEHRFETSIRGLRAELQRKDMDPETRQETEIKILEKMKAQYAEQLRMMITEEMKREVAREVDVRMEMSSIGKERLRNKHERDRAFYKAQLERVRAECELSLAASMAQYNLLR